MRNVHIILLLVLAGAGLAAKGAQAENEDQFLGAIQPSTEQSMGHGHSAVWTLSLVATQYRPSQPTPEMQAALQAQHDGRFLDAMIQLDNAAKDRKIGADARAELGLLRASFLLQGNQSKQALAILAPLHASPQHAADAWALTAMAYLQQGQMQQALDAAQRAHDADEGRLPHLALSYVLQGMGHLGEALEKMHDCNTRNQPSAVTLAREAELELTLDHHQSAHNLVEQAKEMDAANPYVVAVSGLVYLMDGQAGEAKSAFETALKRDPRDAKALLGLGLAEIRLGNFDAGMRELRAANDADPGNALILTYLGRAQQQLGQTEAAMASWRSAEQADPRNPLPWLYQAQAELQANRPLAARESLREAQTRVAYRSVYRGASLLRDDRQLLQANLAEAQRQLGLGELAFQTMSDFTGEPSSTSLRNQADLLQGQRFAESARRSLLLQSLFDEKPGNLPATLDIYGDGAGETGASAPQHGVVGSLSAQQASYNNYGALFTPQTRLAADATVGNQNTRGEQVRAGVGSDTLGLGVAQLRFKTDGNAPFRNLDNGVAQGIVQWRPLQNTQVFAVHQTFDSNWGGVFYPADPFFGSQANVQDASQVTRFGLRRTLSDNSELRGLLSYQNTDQTVDYYDFATPPNYFFSQTGSSNATGAELQYRISETNHASQWGIQHVRSKLISAGPSDHTMVGRHIYAAWQWFLNSQWQLDAGLGWGSIGNHDNTGGGNSFYRARWLPQLGVVYAPDDATHVRLAAWQGMGFASSGDASLSPVSLAGILLEQPGDNGKLVQAIALGADRQLSSDWLLDISAQRRKTGLPAVGGGQLWQQLDRSKLALYWQPQAIPWVVSLAYDYERIHNDPAYTALDSVDQQSLRSGQLDLRWFAATQWTTDLALNHNQVDGTQKSVFGLLPSYRSSFNQVDASVDWKFGNSGTLTAGVRNATDAHFQYAEADPLNPRFSQGRLVYGKVQLAW